MWVPVKKGRVSASGKGRSRDHEASRRGEWQAEYCGRGGRVFSCLPISTHGNEAANRKQPCATFPRKTRVPSSRVPAQAPSGVEYLLIQVNHDLEALAAGSRHGIAGQERLGEPHRHHQPREGQHVFRGKTPAGLQLSPFPPGAAQAGQA